MTDTTPLRYRHKKTGIESRFLCLCRAFHLGWADATNFAKGAILDLFKDKVFSAMA